MPNLTRDELVTQIGLLLNDPSNTRFTAAEKQTKIQAAQEKFVADTRCLKDVSNVSVVADTASYDLPTDVMDIERVALSGIELRRISKFELDRLTGANWSADDGTPGYYYVDLDPNNKKIYLYPVPQSGDAGTDNLVIEYVKIPPTLSTGTSVPLDAHTLLTPYHMALAYKAAYDLLVADPTQENLLRASAFLKEYTKLVDDCVNLFRHMEEDAPLRMGGGRYF